MAGADLRNQYKSIIKQNDHIAYVTLSLTRVALVGFALVFIQRQLAELVPLWYLQFQVHQIAKLRYTVNT